MQVPQFIIISLQVKSIPEGKLHSGTLKNRGGALFNASITVTLLVDSILSQRKNFRQKNSYDDLCLAR